VMVRVYRKERTFLTAMEGSRLTVNFLWSLLVCPLTLLDFAPTHPQGYCFVFLSCFVPFFPELMCDSSCLTGSRLAIPPSSCFPPNALWPSSSLSLTRLPSLDLRAVRRISPCSPPVFTVVPLSYPSLRFPFAYFTVFTSSFCTSLHLNSAPS
jgi:hypothetical protein